MFVTHDSPHIHRRSRIFDWCWHTRGFLAAGRSSPDIWSCTLAGGRWSPATASLGPHSLRGRGSWPPEESRRTQTDAASPCTGRGCHLRDTDGGQIRSDTEMDQVRRTKSSVPKGIKLQPKKVFKGWYLVVYRNRECRVTRRFTAI